MRFFNKQTPPGEAVREVSFTVFVHEAEEGGYWGEVPDLEGCVSQGESLDELTSNIKEAIVAWLSAHAEDEGPHAPHAGMTMSVPVLVPC